MSYILLYYKLSCSLLRAHAPPECASVGLSGFPICAVTLLPKCLKFVNPEFVIPDSPAAPLEQHPLYLVSHCQHHLYEQNPSRIYPYPQQNYPLLRVPRHEEVHIQEDESQYGVEEQPVGDEPHLLNQVPLHPLALVPLRAPGHIVHVAECINEHHMGVGPLVGQVAEHIDQQLPHKLEMSGHVYDRDYHVGQHVDRRDHKYHAGLRVFEQVRELGDVGQLQVHSHHVIDHHPQQQECVEREYV